MRSPGGYIRTDGTADVIVWWGQAGVFWSVAHQPAMLPSDAVAIAGKPFMDEPVGGNSSARVPVNLASGSKFLSRLRLSDGRPETI